MAIIKHIPVKGNNYNAALDYVLFQHDEETGKAILDENGNRILREEYYLDGINVSPMMYARECQALNKHYHKNQNPKDVKAHHYIISFDPRDSSECGLTGERAQQLGIAFAEKYFPGFQTIVCTHTDGNNKSGNIHIHIMFNSVRKLDVEPQSFHERPCDSRAGYKHHETKKYMHTLKKAVMEMCEQEHLHQVDLLSPANEHITDREYRATRRGQKKLTSQNEEIIKSGLVPKTTVFQTQKQYLRDAIMHVSATAVSFEDFSNRLFSQYQITVTETRGRYSYLHPDRNKNISDRALGASYKKDYLDSVFQKNRNQKNLLPAAELDTSYVHGEEKQLRKNENTNYDFHTHEMHNFDPAYDYISNPTAVLLIRTKLRLVVDLQECLKAQQNSAYAQKVKISNLQEMAKTVVFLQANHIGSVKQLHSCIERNVKEIASLEEKYSEVQADLAAVNQQIHYLGQYLSNKAVYSQMLKAPNIKMFRKDHTAQIQKYEKARKELKNIFGSDPFPSMKVLSANKAKLKKHMQSIHKEVQLLKASSSQLEIASANIQAILGHERNLVLQNNPAIGH